MAKKTVVKEEDIEDEIENEIEEEIESEPKPELEYEINEFFNPNGEAWIVVLGEGHELYFFNDGDNSIQRFYELRKEHKNAILAKLSYTPPKGEGSGEFKVASVGWNEIAKGYENMIAKLSGEKDG
ncbi:MAG: hypothetical protein ACFFDK_18610 [Promethearchaeota archaeon]